MCGGSDRCVHFRRVVTVTVGPDDDDDNEEDVGKRQTGTVSVPSLNAYLRCPPHPT